MSHEVPENATPPAGKPRPERMPGKVKAVVVGLWVQVALFALGAVTVLMEAKSKVDHGQDGAGLLVLLAAFTLLPAVPLAVGAVLARRGPIWVWWLTIVVQGFFILVWLIALIPGNIYVLPGLALSGGLVLLLTARDARNWFGHGDPWA
jgi:hypothetical protein